MKSLHEHIAESIDEVLSPDSVLTGREIYLRGWERYYRAHFERMMEQERRQLEKALPLLASSNDPP